MTTLELAIEMLRLGFLSGPIGIAAQDVILKNLQEKGKK